MKMVLFVFFSYATFFGNACAISNPVVFVQEEEEWRSLTLKNTDQMNQLYYSIDSAKPSSDTSSLVYGTTHEFGWNESKMVGSHFYIEIYSEQNQYFCLIERDWFLEAGTYELSFDQNTERLRIFNVTEQSLAFLPAMFGGADGEE
ncbi:hypothetical protein K2X40_01355 [Candidatus Babeliales bacterium]|nr:hypothetical protein [Candidatus Babeliales bacterium]